MVRLVVVLRAARGPVKCQQFPHGVPLLGPYLFVVVVEAPVRAQGVGGPRGVAKRGAARPLVALLPHVAGVAAVAALPFRPVKVDGLVGPLAAVAVAAYLWVAGLPAALYVHVLRHREGDDHQAAPLWFRGLGRAPVVLLRPTAVGAVFGRRLDYVGPAAAVDYFPKGVSAVDWRTLVILQAARPRDDA